MISAYFPCIRIGYNAPKVKGLIRLCSREPARHGARVHPVFVDLNPFTPDMATLTPSANQAVLNLAATSRT